MRTNGLKPYVLISGILLIIDWILGAAQSNGIIPTWTFLIFNFPVGILFVWMEHSWNGSYYSMFGYRIGDIGSILVFLIVVLGQAYLYFRLLILWRTKNISYR